MLGERARIALELTKARLRERKEGPQSAVPRSVSIIMDGNRRWAQDRDLPIIEGHRAGIKPIEAVVDRAADVGVKSVTFWAFSTDNWKRGFAEVGDLMTVYRELFDDPMIDRLIAKGAKVDAIGRMGAFPGDIRRRMRELEERSKDGNRINVHFALNYGGQEEVVDAVNSIPFPRRIFPITARTIEKRLYKPGEHPDLIIRTSGEHRLSGFELWGSKGSEFHFVDFHWPDMTTEAFDDALKAYAGRKIRKGK